MPQLICSVWLWSLFLGMQKVGNASANTLIFESRVFQRSTLFDKCLTYFVQFGFAAFFSPCKKMRKAPANILVLENHVFHKNSLFDECLSQFAQLGVEALVQACKKRGMLQLISSCWKVELFIEAHFSMNASATLLSLALTPLGLAGKKEECFS